MTTPTPRRLTDRKRDAILRAAIEQFRLHGFAGTSMDQIAAAAGASKRTVYNHFPSKDELFAAIIWQLWEQLQAQLPLVYRADLPLRTQLQGFLEHKLALISEPEFVALTRVGMVEFIHNPERARELAARLEQKEEGLTTWIRAAQADGRLRSDMAPARAAAQLQTLLKAQAFWPQLTMGQRALSDNERQLVVSECLDLFLARHATAPENDI